MKTIALEKQILARIQKQNLKPTPRGYFKARDYAIWALFAVFVAAIGMGFGMIIFAVKSADFSLFAKLGLSTYEKVMAAVPFFWILATALVAVVAFISWRMTRTGYRTSTKRFIVTMALIGAAAGSVTYLFNVSQYVNDAANKIPLYHVVVPLDTSAWFNPDQGLLSGFVKSKDSDSAFTLRDREGELWNVTGSQVDIPQGFVFHPGDRIKIIGTRTGNTDFTATEIHPWAD